MITCTSKCLLVNPSIEARCFLHVSNACKTVANTTGLANTNLGVLHADTADIINDESAATMSTEYILKAEATPSPAPAAASARWPPTRPLLSRLLHPKPCQVVRMCAPTIRVEAAPASTAPSLEDGIQEFEHASAGCGSAGTGKQNGTKNEIAKMAL